ncbi:DUF4411 family protein [Deinococcus psychrotolerans]|uniref:DUF4411 family protein n=1 Tax=Deinococcus psychrotolerans TaxID=2489213 RepID=A0A3G8YD32_9DEIO|nr:DUF4411 family protein [Deinococcus psychrotolerans]AZI43248.1 DUF4411 family protein [Deinococcus psychrotolerans]
MTTYVIDTNIFIRLYSWNPREIKLYDHIWSAIDGAIKSGSMITDSTVQMELDKHNSPAKEWVKTQMGLVIPMSNEIFVCAQEIMARCPSLVDPESERNHADPFIIAAALIKDGVAVSDEKPRKQQSDRCKVPDACDEFGVKCLNFTAFANEFPWH